MRKAILLLLLLLAPVFASAQVVYPPAGGGVDTTADYTWTGTHTFLRSFEVANITNVDAGDVHGGYLQSDLTGTAVADSVFGLDIRANVNDDATTESLYGLNVSANANDGFLTTPIVDSLYGIYVEVSGPTTTDEKYAIKATGAPSAFEGVLNVSGARPSCVASVRGLQWYVAGGAGVKDKFEVCAKDAAEAYAWRVLY